MADENKDIDFGQSETSALSALEADLLENKGHEDLIPTEEEDEIATDFDDESDDTDEESEEETVAEGENEEETDDSEEDESDEASENEDEDDESDEEDENEEDEENEEEESEDEDDSIDWLTEQLSDLEGFDLSDPKKAVGELKNKFLEAQTVIEEEAKANEKLIEVLDANPVVESILKNLNDGYTAEEALALNFDIDDLIEMKEDPKVKEKIIEARAERKFSAKEQEKQQEKLKENQKTSNTNLKTFAEQHNLGEDGRKDFTSKMDAVLKPLSEGLVTQEMLDVFYKGLQYESDVSEAQKKARIDEKNKKIQQSKRRKKGDNLPSGKSRKTVSNKRKSKGAIGGIPMNKLATNTDGW